MPNYRSVHKSKKHHDKNKDNREKQRLEKEIRKKQREERHEEKRLEKIRQRKEDLSMHTNDNLILDDLSDDDKYNGKLKLTILCKNQKYIYFFLFLIINNIK